MDKKISQLTAATTPLTGSEEIAIVQSGVTKKTTIEDVKGYKVYTALLTQSGGNSVDSVNGQDNFNKGWTYQIISNPNNEDLTPYGAPNNTVGTYFVCNSDVPANTFTIDLSLSYNTGAPVVTVLENTIGNVYWTYFNTGQYYANLTGAFLSDKTFIVTPSILTPLNINGTGVGAARNNDDSILVQSIDNGGDSDGILQNFPIEIRVYN